MPIQAGGSGAPSVTPSALYELMWAMHFVCTPEDLPPQLAGLAPARSRLRSKLTDLHADGVAHHSAELVVLAHRADALRDLDLDRFFGRLDEAIDSRSPLPTLRSETPEEIDLTRKRLERMRTDRAVRKRYVSVMRELWESVAGEWTERGRPAVVARAQRWTDSLGRGIPYREVLGVEQLWPWRQEVDEFADEAQSEGKLVMSPCWFGGRIHILELDGVVYVGQGIQTCEPAYRDVAAGIASHAKIFADPTRVAILLRLARDPASVTALARQFGLSQPAVSGHVQVLRDAGLLDEKTVGRSAMLSVNADQLRRVFSETERSLFSDIHS